jgi:hypothetical protein
MRVAYYFWYNVLIPLPEVQMKGIVCVYYDTAKPGDKSFRLSLNSLRNLLGFSASLPFRRSTIHVCMKAGKGKLALHNTFLGIIMNALPRYSRVRARLHYGSDLELQYELQGYGLPMKSCPVDPSGEMRQDILNVWYEQHVASIQSRSRSVDQIGGPSSETATSTSVGTGTDVAVPVPLNPNGSVPVHPHIDPTSTDVLLGRGKGNQTHPGNIRFREFLDNYSDEYNKVPRKNRRYIATKLSQMFKSNGVRFLKLNENKEWVESDVATVEDKIAQLFRSSRKKKDVGKKDPIQPTK